MPRKKDIAIKYQDRVEGFQIGQEGEFLLYDSFHKPIETVKGKIVRLMDGDGSLYAIIKTDKGMRPARLCRSAIRQNKH